MHIPCARNTPDYVEKMFTKKSSPDKSEVPLAFVMGGPGVGKSRLLTKLAEWIPEYIGSDAVVVFIKASNLLDYELTREDNCASTALACRLLYSAFCAGGMAYSDFVRDICGGSLASITVDDAVLLIAHARKLSGLSTSFPLVVLCDEAQYLVAPDKRFVPSLSANVRVWLSDEYAVCFDRAPWRLSSWLVALQQMALLEKVQDTVLGVPVEGVVPIIPVFGGTAIHGFCPEENVALYPRFMMYGVGPIFARTLNRDLWCKLVRDSSAWLQVDLSKVAGHMRTVEWFVENVLRTGAWSRAAVQEGLAHAEREARSAFDSWLVARYRPQLIAAVVLGAGVPPDDSLDGETLDSIVRFAPVGIEVGRDRSLHLSVSVVALRAMCGVCAGPFTDAVRALLDAVYEAPPGFEAFQNLCALHLAVQKMGHWVLGRTVTFGDVFRRAVFVGPSETRLFSRNEARAGCAALASIRVVHAPGDVAQLDPVFVNPKGVADVATRLLSNVEQLLVLRRFADREVKASLMAEEVQAVSRKLDAWRRDADAVVVFIAFGEYLDDFRGEFPLPAVVVCRGCGLEELFGPLLEPMALRWRFVE